MWIYRYPRKGNFNLRIADLTEIRRMKIEVGRPIDIADVALIDEFLEITRENSCQ
jgi:hypothetical protein